MMTEDHDASLAAFDADEPVEIEIGDSLDLHAFRPAEMRSALVAYLAEASEKRFPIVRIIHGKGIGVQREMVRKVLTESALVESFKTGDEFSGGWGSTVAKLR